MDVKSPSIILMSAAPRSGKSYLIRHLIYRLSKAGRFDHGIAFTSTSFNGGFDYLPEKAVSNYSEAKLKKFLRYQRENQKPAFIIMDDVLGTVNFQSPLMRNMISTYRHYNLTIFIATQYIYQIPPTIRACVTYAYIFRPKENRSMKALFETYGGRMNYANWQAMIEKNTGNYNAVMICNEEDDPAKSMKKIKAPATPDFKLDF